MQSMYSYRTLKPMLILTQCDLDIIVCRRLSRLCEVAIIFAPIVSLNAEEVSVLHVSYADAPTPSVHSKPNNVAFCELVYKIDVPAPASPADCPERANIARSHEPIVFEPLQRGKQVSAFARWVNKNGKQGPWSGVVTAFVP